MMRFIGPGYDSELQVNDGRSVISSTGQRQWRNGPFQKGSRNSKIQMIIDGINCPRLSENAAPSMPDFGGTSKADEVMT